jgi:hypothetical protein
MSAERSPRAMIHFYKAQNSHNAFGGKTLNIDTLTRHVKAGEIQELNLVSLEGGSYVLHALLDQKSLPVEDSHGQPLHLASVEEARKVLSGVPDARLFLVQAVAHDEMVGQDSVQPEASRHEVPLRSSL